MALQGFNEAYYLQVKLAALQADTATATEWASKTVDDLSTVLTDAGFTAESHYQQYGQAEGLAPNAYFNADEYVEAKAVQMVASGSFTTTEAAKANFEANWPYDPYLHYLSYGSAENVNASNAFDESSYLATKLAALQADTATATEWATKTVDDVAKAFADAGLSAVGHYELYGKDEGIAVTPVPAAEQVVVATSGATFTLTASPDTATANVFTADRVWNPGGTDYLNSLNDDDVLTGTGTNPTLNMTFTNDTESGDQDIMPDLNNIETINVEFTANGNQTLDLQDTTGLLNLNATRIDNSAGNVTFDNIQSVLATASVMNSNDNTASNMIFDHQATVLAGDADEVALTLGNVQMNVLRMDGVTQGYETINLTSSMAANSLNTLTIEEAKVLNITGDTDLTLGQMSSVMNGTSIEAATYAAGLANVAGSLSTINASTEASPFTGALDITLGGELNAGTDGTSGVPMKMTVTGGTGDDIFRIAQGASIDAAATSLDTIAGGEGVNKLVLLGGAAQTVTAATAANITNVQSLEVLTGHDLLAGAGQADVVTVDADAFDALASIYVRNEGQTALTSAAEGMTVNLNDLTAAQALAVTVAHGTTGNSNIANNIVNVSLKTATGTADTATLTIVDGTNTDLRFNMQYGAASIEGITINDSDTEDNTIALRSVADHKTAITLAGGEVGDFLNLDTTTAGANGGLYNYAIDGSTTTSIAATLGQVSDLSLTPGQVHIGAVTFDASAELGNVVARFSTNAASVVGAQTITMGAGNDTVIFDNLSTATVPDTRAGLTISDKVDGGAGTDTLVIDGNLLAAGTIALSASEWTNVKGFETIRTIGAGAGSDYKLVLTDGLIAANNKDGLLAIVNDNDAWNDAARKQSAVAALAADATVGNENDIWAVAESAITIDARTLSSTSHFSYNGEEGITRSADRIILADAGINGSTIIDGGAINNITDDMGIQKLGGPVTNGVIVNGGNADILEIRNAAVVSQGDLDNVSNIGTLSFTNDLSVTQVATLQLNDTIVDRMVDSYQASASRATVTSATAAANVEALTINAMDNMNVAGATTGVTIEAGTLTDKSDLNITLGRGINNVTTGAGQDSVVLLGGYVAGTYAGIVNGVNLNDQSTATAAVHTLAATEVINLGGGLDTLTTYGAINLAPATLAGIEVMVANSDVTMTQSQFNALTSLTFTGASAHTLTIADDVVGVGTGLDLSKIVLSAGAGSLAVDTASKSLVGGVVESVAGDGSYVNSPVNNSTTGSVTVNAAILDTTAPVFTSAAVDGATLTMTYGEALNGAAAPQLGSFAVTVNGTAAAASAVTVSGSSVALTLGTAVSSTDVVTVSYTDPTTANDALAIQDVAGNDSVSLVNAAVTNNTAASGGGGTSTTQAVDATTAAAALSALGSDVTFTIASATYTQEITDFAAGDVLDFADGNIPTVNNTSFTDGAVDVQFALGGTTTVIHLTGIATATDAMLNSVADFDTVFGAGTII